MMQPGSVMFVKHCKASSRQDSQTYGFKGHGFGIFLGVVPPMVKEPTEGDVVSILGALGFIAFDDIGRIMGEEVLKDLLARIEVMHQERMKIQEEKLKEAKEQAAQSASEEPSLLLNAHGRPLDEAPKLVLAKKAPLT